MNGRNSKSEILWKGLHYVKALPFRKRIRMYLAEKDLFTMIVHLQCLKQTNKKNRQEVHFSLQNLSSILEQGYRLPQEVSSSPKSLGKFYLISEGGDQKNTTTTHTHAHRHTHTHTHCSFPAVCSNSSHSSCQNVCCPWVVI